MFNKVCNSVIAKVCLAVIMAGSTVTIANSSELANTLVTAKSNQGVIDTAGSYSIINSDEIIASGANNILEVLSEQPGITIAGSARESSSDRVISIRGAYGKHTLVLINGKRVNASDGLIQHSSLKIDWLPLDAIERIEVIRGPMSVLYGSDAMGGVVNIITKKGVEEESTMLGAIPGIGTLSLYYGSDEQGVSERRIGIGYLGNITNNVSLSLFSSYKNNGLREFKKYVPAKNGLQSMSFLADVAYLLNENADIALSYLYSNDTTKGVFNALRRGSSSKTSGVKSYYGDTHKAKKHQYSITYNQDLGSINTITKLYVTSLDSDNFSSSYASNSKMQDTVASLDIDNSIDTAFGNNYIVGGIEYRNEMYSRDYTSKARPDFKDNINYLSVYLQDEISINPVIVTLGLRYDKHQNFGGNISPKVYGVYKVNNDHRFKFGYGEAFSAPNIQQTSDKYFLDRTNSRRHYAIWRGNPNVKPQTAKNYEIGYEMALEQSYLATTIFMGTIHDLIGIVTTQKGDYKNKKPGKATYMNVADANVKGVEFEFSQKNIIADVFDIGINYTYLDMKMKDGKEPGGRPLNNKPKHNINANVELRPLSGTTINLKTNYIGKIQLEDSIDRKTGKKLPGVIHDPYTIFSVQTSYQIKDDMRIYFGIDNVANTQLNDLSRAEIRGRFYYLTFSSNF